MASRHFRSCRAQPTASLLRKMRWSRANSGRSGWLRRSASLLQESVISYSYICAARRRQAPYSGGSRGTDNGRSTNGSAATILDRRRRYLWRDAACDWSALRDPVFRLFEVPLGLVPRTLLLRLRIIVAVSVANLLFVNRPHFIAVNVHIHIFVAHYSGAVRNDNSPVFGHCHASSR